MKYDTSAIYKICHSYSLPLLPSITLVWMQPYSYFLVRNQAILTTTKCLSLHGYIELRL